MSTSKIKVVQHPGTNVRSFVLSEGSGSICKEDGFAFRGQKTKEEGYGVITLQEAMLNYDGEVSSKVGDVGREIIRQIGISRSFNKRLIEGRLVSSKQLTIQFKAGVDGSTIEKFIIRIIGEALSQHARLANLAAA